MVHNILYTRFTSHWVVPTFFSVQSKYEEKSIFLPWDFLLESSSSHHLALMLLSNIFTLSISWIFFIVFIYFYDIVEFNSWFCFSFRIFIWKCTISYYIIHLASNGRFFNFSWVFLKKNKCILSFDQSKNVNIKFAKR